MENVVPGYHTEEGGRVGDVGLLPLLDPHTRHHLQTVVSTENQSEQTISSWNILVKIISDLQFGTQLWFRRDTLRYSPARFLAEPVARTWNVLVSRIQRISVISCSLTRPGKREQNNSAFSLTNWKSGCSLLCSMLVDNCRHFLYLKYI